MYKRQGDAGPKPQKARLLHAVKMIGQLVVQLKQARGLLPEQPAGRRQVDAAVQPFKQPAAHLLLKIADGMRNRRLGHVERLGCPGKAQRIADSLKHL